MDRESRQDREVLEHPVIAFILQGFQSGAIKFGLEIAITLLGNIAETANPPLLPDLKNVDYVRKCIGENDELFHLLGECFQKRSFSEIWSLEMLQPVSNQHPGRLKQLYINARYRLKSDGVLQMDKRPLSVNSLSKRNMSHILCELSSFTSSIASSSF
ncbi:hypothetical protein BU17DRAFT_103686 [Hysterangium stoloniferum]|nr:hypothetical protein BU17DRAFT_103686 [Hysterangium stoloniferum]